MKESQKAKFVARSISTATAAVAAALSSAEEKDLLAHSQVVMVQVCNLSCIFGYASCQLYASSSYAQHTTSLWNTTIMECRIV